jgi:hypothetical protein
MNSLYSAFLRAPAQRHTPFRLELLEILREVVCHDGRRLTGEERGTYIVLAPGRHTDIAPNPPFFPMSRERRTKKP